MQIALRAQQVGPAEPGRGVVRIRLDGAVEVRQRGVVAVDLPVGQRPVGQGRNGARIDLDRLGEIRDGFLIAADARISGAARVQGA